MNINDHDYETLLLKIDEMKAFLANGAPEPKNEGRNRVLQLTEKEICKMPKNVRKIFRMHGMIVHYRKRTNGRYRCSYEIRYAKKPYDKRPITASGQTLEEAKEKFLSKIKDTPISEELNSAAKIPSTFDDFAMYWFENFHKRKVAERTYSHDIKLYNRHIKENFQTLKVKEATAVYVQTFLEKFKDKGKTRKDLQSILNQTFDCAVKHGLIKLNPIGMCFIENYEKTHGTLITKVEETTLLNAFIGTIWELAFALALYTGVRPCEYETIELDGDFIKAVNSKRKNGKIEYKYIPISPMLKPYLERLQGFKMPTARSVNLRFKKILPNHKIYDMRTTFQTRCSECGIPDSVIGIFMGNSIGKLKEAYTDFSKEYLIKEAGKFKY